MVDCEEIVWMASPKSRKQPENSDWGGPFSLEAKFLLLWGISAFLLRSSTDCMRPTHYQR
jgi:hypothetical protein